VWPCGFSRHQQLQSWRRLRYAVLVHESRLWSWVAPGVTRRRESIGSRQRRAAAGAPKGAQKPVRRLWHELGKPDGPIRHGSGCHCGGIGTGPRLPTCDARCAWVLCDGTISALLPVASVGKGGASSDRKILPFRAEPRQLAGPPPSPRKPPRNAHEDPNIDCPRGHPE